MLIRPTWKLSPVLYIEVFSVARCALDQVVDQCFVFRMNSLNRQLQGRLCLSVVVIDPEGLVRPEDLPAPYPPPETSRVTKSLRLGQVRVPAPQLLRQLLLLGNVHRAAN